MEVRRGKRCFPLIQESPANKKTARMIDMTDTSRDTKMFQQQKGCKGKGYSHCFKLLPSQLFISYKGER